MSKPNTECRDHGADEAPWMCECTRADKEGMARALARISAILVCNLTPAHKVERIEAALNDWRGGR